MTTSGCRNTSAVSPSAIRLPKLSTVRCSRDAGDQGHVVVDDEDRQALRGDPVEQVVQRLLLAGVEARGGFVEQQHRRVGRERARDLDQALMAVGEARNGLVGAAPQPDEVERGAGAALQRAVTGLDQRVAVALGADHDVLQRGHRAEQADVLKRAREPGAGALVRGQGGDVDAVDEDRARRSRDRGR